MGFLIIWLKNGPYAQHMYINCRKVWRWGWSLSFSFWRPTLVNNSPLAFKFISLLSKARKNSLPPRFFFISLLSKARKNKKLLPPPLDKNEVFGISDITYFGLLYVVPAVVKCTPPRWPRNAGTRGPSGCRACAQGAPLDTVRALRRACCCGP